MNSDIRTMSVLAVFLIVFSGCVLVLSDSEESDAATYSVEQGSSITVPTGFDGTLQSNQEIIFTGSISSEWSISVSSSGTTATITVPSIVDFGVYDIAFHLYNIILDDVEQRLSTHIITVVAPSTLVHSITISGPSTVYVGSSITLTATTSPTDADDRGVVWTITSGSTRVTYTTSDTTTGGKIVLTGVSAGSVTVKATAADGSGVYATKTITVSNNIYYLYYDANGGSGAPSTQSYSAGSALTHSFTISSTAPVRDGFDFKGWATNSSGTGTIYQPGDTIRVLKNSSVTLYAVWEESEPDLAFTTVPTQDDVTLPEIVYNDDGTYIIQEASL